MQQHQPRIEDRTKVMVRASLRARDSERDACILDISTRGLSATTAIPPARGEFVELKIGKNILVGHVKWSGERRFGVALRERISVIAAISGEGDLVMQTRQRPRAEGGRRDQAAHRKTGRAIEFLAFAAMGVAAMVVLAQLASSALAPLSTVELALAGNTGDVSASTE